ncbi:MAG TPA: hypothetical protein VN132_08395 [Bdellovibrio sp.]|nr:hypothetical protein [Bdellovibrio sp.]
MPTTLAEVQKSLSDGWGQSDPAAMAPSDFVYLETEQQLEQQDPRLVLQEGITVSKKDETDKEINFTFLYQSAIINGNQSQQSTREDHRCVAKSADGCSTTSASSDTSNTSPGTSSTTAAKMAVQNFKQLQDAAVTPSANDQQMELGFEKFIGLAYSCQKSDAFDQYCKTQLGADSCDIQCSNLKSTDEIVDAPPLIKAQANCGGLADCKIHLKRVSFNWDFTLKKDNATQTQKINYMIALSPDMPFLSRVMEYCSRGLITIPQTGNKALVSICSRVKNYKPAAAP